MGRDRGGVSGGLRALFEYGLKWADGRLLLGLALSAIFRERVSFALHDFYVHLMGCGWLSYKKTLVSHYTVDFMAIY